MRVLVTGHEGYIGTVLVPLLRKAGHELTGLDSDLFERCTFGEEYERIPSLRKDVRDVELRDLEGFDAVLHLAGLSNDPLGDLDPDHPGLEVFGIHENEGDTVRFQTPGTALFDARTGQVLWSAGPGDDVGRGMSADVDPRYPGEEMWTTSAGLRTAKGERIGNAVRSQNFGIWWDGDDLRELLDGNLPPTAIIGGGNQILIGVLREI